MRTYVGLMILLLTAIQGLAQKFIVSGSLGLAHGSVSNSIYNRVGAPQWDLYSKMFDDISSFPYAIGIDMAFEYKKMQLQSGVRYIGTNHIASYTSYNEPSVRASSKVNYFMSTIEIPLLFSYKIWEPKAFRLTASLGASFNYNSTTSWSTSSSLAVIDSGAVEIGSFIGTNQEPFFSIGTIAGIQVQPRKFLKQFSIGCYYNTQWQGGAKANIGTSIWTGNASNQRDYNLTYDIRPSYLVMYIKYDLFDFSLRQ
ncbi:MAG: hypothetical protein MUE96_03465 [Bacteroidia bacterium]|nr:hypothetical protein [Bacteroidia bacterium]